ncbi:hypothetical protein Tco_0995283 [Tanacetum coccineum]
MMGRKIETRPMGVYERKKKQARSRKVLDAAHLGAKMAICLLVGKSATFGLGLPIARRAVDELIEFIGENEVLKLLMKGMVELRVVLCLKYKGSGSSHVVTRHEIDEIVEFSGETETPKYMKVFIQQEIAEARKMEAMNDLDEYFDSLIFSSIRNVFVGRSVFQDFIKKRRLVAELEALRERGDVARSLEHMREIVARDFVTLRDLE